MVDWINFTGVLTIPFKAKEDPVISLHLDSGKIPNQMLLLLLKLQLAS